MMGRLLFVAGLLAAFAACSEPGASDQAAAAQADPIGENTAAPMEWNGHQSLVADEMSVVATTQAEWEELWRRVGRAPPAALPDNRIAIGIFLGRRNTAGYRVEIVSAEQQDGKLVVVYEEHVPSGAAAMVLTYPYVVRLIPQDSLPVQIEKRP